MAKANGKAQRGVAKTKAPKRKAAARKPKPRKPRTPPSAAFLAHSYQPGQSGNPAGRPKRVSFEAWVHTVLDEQVPGTDTTKREAAARVFVDMVLHRNGAMIREFMAREWPATQLHEIVEPTDRSELDALMDRFRPATRQEVPRRHRGNGTNGSGEVT